jgi:hypothetical protein
MDHQKLAQGPELGRQQLLEGLQEVLLPVSGSEESLYLELAQPSDLLQLLVDLHPQRRTRIYTSAH